MVLSFFKRGRKAPPALDIPECLPISREEPTLLDLFSQEVGSASSASSWKVPDIIYQRVEESNVNCSEDASLSIQGGNMDEFDNVDPNDPETLDRCLNWIDQEYYDEQYIMRQESQDSLQNVHQVSLHMEARINPGITTQPFQQLQTHYPARMRGYLVFPCPQSPSVDDSSSDEEPDEFTSSKCKHKSFIVDSDSDSEEGFDPEKNIAVTRIISRQGRILHDDGDVVCFWKRRNPKLSIANSSSLGSDFEEHEKADENLGDVQMSDSYNSSAIPCFSPSYQIGSNMSDPGYDADTDDDFEAHETMWNSNRAILQNSDLLDSEFIGRRGQVLDSRAHISASRLDNYETSSDDTDHQVTKLDSRNVSEDLRYRISRSFGVFDVPDGSEIASSVHKDTTYELNSMCAEQSMFSPTSIYSNDIHQQHDILPTGQHPFSPSSPAARNPFSSSFSWPTEPHDFDQMVVCPGPQPLRLIFGNGGLDQFAFTFTFTHDSLLFPPEGCICRFDERCHMHPPRAFCQG